MSSIIITSVDQYNDTLKQLYLLIKEKYNHNDLIKMYNNKSDLDKYLKSLIPSYYMELLEINEIINLRSFYKDIFSINVKEAAIKLYIKRHLKLEGVTSWALKREDKNKRTATIRIGYSLRYQLYY